MDAGYHSKNPLMLFEFVDSIQWLNIVYLSSIGLDKSGQ